MANIFDLDQKICACAACGVAQSEGIDSAGPYVEFSLLSLQLLLLSNTKRKEYYQLDRDMRQAWGVYPQVSNEDEFALLYHLHPQFVVINIIMII